MTAEEGRRGWGEGQGCPSLGASAGCKDGGAGQRDERREEANDTSLQKIKGEKRWEEITRAKNEPDD